jgi:hypothetical protein
MVAFPFPKPGKEHINALHCEPLSFYKMSRAMARPQNAIHTRPTQWHLPSKRFFNTPFLYQVFDVLKDVLSERTKADLLEDILEKLLAFKDSFELLH